MKNSPTLPLSLLSDLSRMATSRDTSLPVLRSARQIYTNRSLKLDSIQIIGFDMDYTLAAYSMRHIEELAFRMTLDRLVARRGYPELILGIQYDHEFVIRGLVVDKDHGNIFKMDRHSFVGRCYHGRRALSVEDRRLLYQNEKVRIALPRFAWIDTLFSLPEACLYADIIELLERPLDGRAPQKVDTHKLYDDIRASIDEVHRDGTLKQHLKPDLAKFVVKDPELGPALHKLRSGGKKLFLLTNSLWDYTDAVMSYLLDGLLPEYLSWRNYFDLVLVGAQKPGFFTEQKPFVEIAADGSVASSKVEEFERGKVYEGGNLLEFERLSGFSGTNVLYVGDHIYGDIIRNRKSSLWRTCLIVQELEQEIDYMEAHAADLERMSQLEGVRTQLDDLINHHKMLLTSIDRVIGKAPPSPELELRRGGAKSELESLRGAFRSVAAEADLLEERFETGANRFWGLVFKEGHENSRFGEQVEDYADLYTSRVSNLLYTSPAQYFRSPRQRMAHEQRGTRRP